MVDSTRDEGTRAQAGASGPVLAPHPPLADYYDQASERSRWVRGIFNRTAVDYDRVERMMAFGSGPWYRRQALLRAGLAPRMDVLDVGTGTGLVAREILGIIGDPTRLTGVDPSPGMLAASRLPPQVRLLDGTAERLPVDSDAFDFVSMGFALRHVADLNAAFREFHRALRPGGRVCILEISRPRGRLATHLLRAYMRGVVPLYARLFASHPETAPLMRYYWDTIEACVPPVQVLAALRDAGFERPGRHVELGIFSEYMAVKPGGDA